MDEAKLAAKKEKQKARNLAYRERQRERRLKELDAPVISFAERIEAIQKRLDDIRNGRGGTVMPGDLPLLKTTQEGYNVTDLKRKQHTLELIKRRMEEISRLKKREVKSYRMQKLTAKEKREYIRGHYQEQTIEQLAEHLGITRQGVLYYLRKMGVKSSPLRPYRLDKHVQAEVCRMGGKVSDKALGVQLGVPFSVVKYYRNKYGIPPYTMVRPDSGK